MLLSELRLFENVTIAMRSAPKGRVAVAVSGGGDSVALLLLMADWAVAEGRVLDVVTVDHGLRPEAATEAEFVGNLCDNLGLQHTILHWRGWNQQGNLQNAARLARRELIADWALGRDIETVTLGHTRDDQAETFLMRLARGSGVDGLAAMYAAQQNNGLFWLRPLLGHRRAELREFLQGRDVAWVDDPSNEDVRFDRIKMRKALGMLDDLGLGVDVLSETATRMQRARQALETATLELAQAVAEPRESGAVRVQLAGFSAAPQELKLRLLAHAIGWVSKADYRPRLQSLKRTLAGIEAGNTRTLAGCLINPITADVFEVCREPNAIIDTQDLSTLFDGRWQVHCRSELSPITVCALGKNGILQRPNWRQTAESRNVVLSMPSFWYNNELMSVPLLDKDGPCSCTLLHGVQSFYSSILTH